MVVLGYARVSLSYRALRNNSCNHAGLYARLISRPASSGYLPLVTSHPEHGARALKGLGFRGNLTPRGRLYDASSPKARAAFGK